MGVKAGEPAEVTDTWLRVLTDERYIKSDGTVHNSAFGGRAIAQPQGSGEWTLELSGRLLSLVTDLDSESRAFCAGRTFAGILYQTVENLRQNGDGFFRMTGCRTDVIFTPTADPAHADLVAYGPTEESKFLIRDWLQDFIQVVRAEQADLVEGLRKPEAMIVLNPGAAG